ncbi:MAG: hypothetical protein K6B44_03985 [Lachnospiraceae bacterium]|nr:hypothetical protein [Lachnospiraceae bacterium]
MRDLNKEYKDMVLNETPDIWSKIEAGLDERQKAAQPVIAAAPKRKTFKLTRMMGYVGAAAAAVLCICLVAPLLKGSRDAATAESNAPRHIRSAAPEAAADTAAASQEMYDTAEIDTLTGGSKKERNKAEAAVNYSADAAEIYMEEAEESAAAAGERDVADEAKMEELLAAGKRMLKLTLVPGADAGALEYLINEFSLSPYDEYDNTILFVIPEGIDVEELKDIIEKDENIAESEIITTIDDSIITR